MVNVGATVHSSTKCSTLNGSNGSAYILNLRSAVKLLKHPLIREEEQFAKTLEQGLKFLEGELAHLKGKTFQVKLSSNFMILTVSPTDLTARYCT